jgi:hypothetical protein
MNTTTTHLGRPIYFEPSEAARDLFERIIISRFSLRDASDEVLSTDGGLAYIPTGASKWRLALDETAVLAHASGDVDPATTTSTVPDSIVVTAGWYQPDAARAANIKIEAGGNANVFHGLGAVLVPDGFHIPIVVATPENVGHYGLTLIKRGDTFLLQSEEFDLLVARYTYGENYRRDFLIEARGGGGYFVETHNFPHLHVPLSPDCGGYITIGKRESQDAYQFTAFQIPYGYALHTPANTIHGDGTIVGDHAISVATTSAEADTVLFYNEQTRAMARNVFPG